MNENKKEIYNKVKKVITSTRDESLKTFVGFSIITATLAAGECAVRLYKSHKDKKEETTK